MAVESQDLGSTMNQRLEIAYGAGQVKRMHTVPTLGNHSVGEHVYGSLLIAQELCGENRIGLDMRHYIFLKLLYHDAAEVMTGDVPAPVKRKFPKVKEAFDEMESYFDNHVGIPNPPLSDMALKIVKACDTLDLLFNVLRELRFGNRHKDLHIVWRNCMSYIQAQTDVSGVGSILMHLASEYLHVGER